MRSNNALPIAVLIVFSISFLPVNTADSVSPSGDLILRDGPWHVGDEIEFSILVHNSDSELITTFLSIEINGEISNSSNVIIDPGNSMELISFFEAQNSGVFAVNWSVYDSNNTSVLFSGTSEVIISEQQSLSTEIYSLSYDYDEGYSINWGANLSDGKSRLISSKIYFVTNEGLILASKMDMSLEPGLRTLSTDMGIAPKGTYKVEIILQPLNWNPLNFAFDEENIESEISGLSLEIISGPSPEFPTLGDTVTIALELKNNGPLEIGSGTLIAVDGQKRVLAEIDVPAINSNSERQIELRINEWMSISTTTLEIIWLMDEYVTKTNLEVISSNSDLVSEDTNISINWVGIVMGLVIALLIIFSVRIVSAKNQAESTETKTYSDRNKKVEEKPETEKRTVDCPSCPKQLQVPFGYSGQVKCPSCLAQFSAKNELEEKSTEEELEIEEEEELFASSDNDIVECPKCDQGLRVPYEKRPAKARCPACKCIFNAITD